MKLPTTRNLIKWRKESFAGSDVFNDGFPFSNIEDFRSSVAVELCSAVLKSYTSVASCSPETFSCYNLEYTEPANTHMICA